ncbi:DUF4267 domain-containing protein [Litorilituus sediminis]|uniref:DUF4267 domain-containing protein n=1 Tax=Litorilituus sediminis TaxID=718192 RepID=A0A4P6PBA3_9GAMM|nr:DUF4267 domain-containing protein [Litorilituus sediminis]QBG36907.1 DUF4267 domain-containing protein [Litorilituus sediminis]
MVTQHKKLETLGFILVLLMVLLQGFYGIFAYIEPANFADIRGTALISESDQDWVKIYGSRTIFITSILAYLLYSRNFVILMWCALLGIVMPVSDALLAYNAEAATKVIIKHLATIIYLLLTYFVLRRINSQIKSKHQ